MAPDQRLFHQGHIAPEVFQTLGDSEKCGEVRRVHQYDVSGTFVFWRHPQQAVELRVARCGEGVRTLHLDRLARQHVDCLALLFGDLVVRKMPMEAQCGDVLEQPRLIQVTERCERCGLPGAFDERRTESPGVVYRYPERLHQRAAVLRKSLLARNEAIPMMQVFHLA